MEEPTHPGDLTLGSQLNVFCQTCWRVWPLALQEAYTDAADFDKRNRLSCPLCGGNHCRAATASDVTVKPKGGDRI
jgi:hypothetical protein